MRSAPAAFIQPRLSLAACLVGVLLTACGGSDDPVDGATHAIGGTLTGLAPNTELVLTNNGGDTLRLTANGVFTFAAPSSGYRVEVSTQPAGQSGTVIKGC